MAKALSDRLPVSYSLDYDFEAHELWKVISSPNHLNLFHPFCKSNEVINNFRDDVTAFQQDLTSANISLSRSLKTTNAMLRALNKASRPTNELFKKLNSTKILLLTIDKELNGDSVKDEIGERSNPSASDGGSLGWTAFGNTYGPTDEHMRLLNRVKSQLKKVKNKLYPIINLTLPSLRNELIKTGAPWIEGQGLIND